MLTIVPIYFVGKAYYELAKLHHRSAWGYAVLGACIFLGAQFVLGFLIGIILMVTDANLDIPSFVLSLIAIVIGAASAYGIQNLLKRKWERKPKDEFSELLDQ
ncbi:hypothetical protein D3C71_565920 [compost metagenome]